LRHADQSEPGAAFLAGLIESGSGVADAQFYTVGSAYQSDVNGSRTGMFGDVLQRFLNDSV
jgi:hypothetical protein